VSCTNKNLDNGRVTTFLTHGYTSKFMMCGRWPEIMSVEKDFINRIEKVENQGKNVTLEL
jgi:hypothetical protein